MAVEAEKALAARALHTYCKHSRTIIPRTIALLCVFTCRESVGDPERDGPSWRQLRRCLVHTSLNSSSLSPWHEIH